MAFFRPLLNQPPDESRAMSALADIVRQLTRQKRRQLLLEAAWQGIFWGLCLAVAAMLAYKIGPWQPDLVTTLGVAVGVPLVFAVLRAWMRRPSSLDVAILADIELRLKQQLSTAWEFVKRDGDSATSRQLAVAAVSQRYPPPAQAVFPVRAGIWGRLAPLAALMLGLVALLELPGTDAPATSTFDQVLIREGEAIRRYATRMQARAEQDALPRSQLASERMRSLGERMANSSLAREQAVYRLQDLSRNLSQARQAALAEAETSSATQTRDEPSLGQTPTSELRDMLEQLLQGRLTPADLAEFQRDAEQLARSGVSSDELREALENFARGDTGEVAQMVEDLAGMEAAEEDAEELRAALERVARARENLGDLAMMEEEHNQDAPQMAIIRQNAGSQERSILASRNWHDEAGDFYAQQGPGAGRGEAPGAQPRRLKPDASREEVALRPQGQLRQGGGFATQARVLPRVGEASVAVRDLDPRFAAQVEEVFNQENYPLHHKEFVRRYFLSLSGDPGATTEEQQ